MCACRAVPGTAHAARRALPAPFRHRRRPPGPPGPSLLEGTLVLGLKTDRSSRKRRDRRSSRAATTRSRGRPRRAGQLRCPGLHARRGSCPVAAPALRDRPAARSRTVTPVLGEGVSGLGVSVQAQSLNLLVDLCRASGRSYMFAHRTYRSSDRSPTSHPHMHKGRVVESRPRGRRADVLAEPRALCMRLLRHSAPQRGW